MWIVRCLWSAQIIPSSCGPDWGKEAKCQQTTTDAFPRLHIELQLWCTISIKSQFCQAAYLLKSLGPSFGIIHENNEP